MANNRAFVVGSIFGGIIATIVVGNILSHRRNIEAETTNSEPKTDDTVSYSDAERDTILSICEQFSEKNKPSNERM